MLIAKAVEEDPDMQEFDEGAKDMLDALPEEEEEEDTDDDTTTESR